MATKRFFCDGSFFAALTRKQVGSWAQTMKDTAKTYCRSMADNQQFEKRENLLMKTNNLRSERSK
jgi:hypothetical protein